MNYQISDTMQPSACKLALAAALNTDQRFAAAFDDWQTVVDVEELPNGQFALLPLICRNLEYQGIDHPWLSRLKGVYRKIWYSNQLVLRTLTGTLTALSRAEIPALLVGSAALAHSVYPEPAQRPISPPEIVVPTGHAQAALACLQGAGWQFNPSLPPPATPEQLAWRPGRRLTGPQGQALLLWWHVLPNAPAAELDSALWQRAVPLPLEESASRTLDPTDHLLRVCQMAAPHTPIALADAALLVQNRPIDWSRLLATAGTYRLGLSGAYCLGTLLETLDSPVPPETLAALRQIPAHAFEQRAHRAFLTPPVERSLVQRSWLHYNSYRRTAEFGGLPISLASLGRYFRYIHQSRLAAQQRVVSQERR